MRRPLSLTERGLIPFSKGLFRDPDAGRTNGQRDQAPGNLCRAESHAQECVDCDNECQKANGGVDKDKEFHDGSHGLVSMVPKISPTHATGKRSNLMQQVKIAHALRRAALLVTGTCIA